MNKWYFTFGAGQPFAGYCQPISAPTYKRAREKMFEVYGGEWAFCYTWYQWDAMKNDKNRAWMMEKELEEIVCK